MFVHRNTHPQAATRTGAGLAMRHRRGWPGIAQAPRWLGLWGLLTALAAGAAPAAQGQETIVLLPSAPSHSTIDLRFISSISGASRRWIHPGATPFENTSSTRATIRSEGTLTDVVAYQLVSTRFLALDADTPYTLYVLVDPTAMGEAVLATTTLRTAMPPAPTLSVTLSGRTAASLSLTLLSSANGTVFIRAQTDFAALDATAIVALPDVSVPISAGTPLAHTLSSLQGNTAYRVHAVVRDGDSILSAPVARNFTTLDATTPVAEGLVAVAGAREASLWFVPSETGQAWLLASTETGLSQSRVSNQAQAIVSVSRGETVHHRFDGLSERTGYTLYVVLQDPSGNRSVASRRVATTDATRPAVDASLVSSEADGLLVRFVSSEGGTAHLLTRTRAITERDTAIAIAKSLGRSITVSAASPVTHQFSGLDQAVAYHVYIAVEDADGNTGLARLEATTLDATSPTVTALLAEAGASTAALRFHASEPGRAWLLASPDGALDAAEVMASASAVAGVAPGTLHRHVFSGLAEATAYTLYAAVADAAGNVGVGSATVTTRDVTPPDVVALSASAGANTAALSFWSGEGGVAWLLADPRPGLGALQVRRAAGASSMAAQAGARTDAAFAGLDEDSDYTLYAALADAAGNLALASAAVRTADATAPSATAMVAVAGAREASLWFVPSETGQAWLLASTETGLSQSRVSNQAQAIVSVSRGETVHHRFDGLSERTGYTLYVVLQDPSGNRSVASRRVATTDATRPAVDASLVSSEADGLLVRFVANEDGTAYLLARTRAIAERDTAIATAKNLGASTAVSAASPSTHQFSGLDEAVAYHVYIAVEDADGNAALARLEATTLDATPPAVTAVLAEAGATTAALRFHAGEPGRAWLLASADGALGAAEVMASASAVAGVAPGTLHRHVFSGLAEATAYTLYAAVADESGNVALATATVTTRDATPPDVVALSASAGASTAALSFWSGEGGVAWLLADRRAGLGALQVRRAAGASSMAAQAGARTDAAFAGLAEDTAYTLYAALADAAGNLAHGLGRRCTTAETRRRPRRPRWPRWPAPERPRCGSCPARRDRPGFWPAPKPDCRKATSATMPRPPYRSAAARPSTTASTDCPSGPATRSTSCCRTRPETAASRRVASPRRTPRGRRSTPACCPARPTASPCVSSPTRTAPHTCWPGPGPSPNGTRPSRPPRISARRLRSRRHRQAPTSSAASTKPSRTTSTSPSRTPTATRRWRASRRRRWTPRPRPSPRSSPRPARPPRRCASTPASRGGPGCWPAPTARWAPPR